MGIVTDEKRWYERGGIMDTKLLQIKERRFWQNPRFPLGYQVQDQNGKPLVSHSGLHGWGWCASKEDAILHAGIELSEWHSDPTNKPTGTMPELDGPGSL
jgi:hypothetical protein